MTLLLPLMCPVLTIYRPRRPVRDGTAALSVQHGAVLVCVVLVCPVAPRRYFKGCSSAHDHAIHQAAEHVRAPP